MSNVPDLFAGRPPSLARVSANARAELQSALAAYRDAEALGDHFDGRHADLTASQRARVALVKISDARDPEADVFRDLHATEGRLVAAIWRLGRRLPCSTFREDGEVAPCKGIAIEGRLYLALDVTKRDDPRNEGYGNDSRQTGPVSSRFVHNDPDDRFAFSLRR